MIDKKDARSNGWIGRTMKQFVAAVVRFGGGLLLRPQHHAHS
jgi:hypothetical protein